MDIKSFGNGDSTGEVLDMDRRHVTLGHGSPGDDLDLSLLASIVHNCIQEDKLIKLKASLKRFTVKDQRRRIVSQKINGNAPLFTASFHGKVHFVNFLLDECGADVEQSGIYEVEEDHSRHEVTPLWCAAVANQLECVKALIRHGADINSPSDTDSTPVRSACYMTNIPVIKYLVDNGANIHKPNINGGTCLINSVQNADLCEFLINKGADVNAKDNSGNLALHYAIREARIETVKLLLWHGSDDKGRNDFGDDALQTAALRGYPEIVEIILQLTTQSVPNALSAYELLGTNYVDERNDMVEALLVWKKAMKMRYMDKQHPIKKEFSAETNYVYCHCKEPETPEELNNLFDPEVIHMQALLIRERILGPNHKDTAFGLMYRGAVYADSRRYQRCVDLWKYAYILRSNKCEPLNQECLFTIQALVKLFWEIQIEVESKATDESIRLPDALDILRILLEQIRHGKEFIQTLPLPANSASDFQLLMQLVLHLIHLISRLVITDEQKIESYKLVHELVMLDPRGTEGESLLHLAVDPRISLTSEEFYSPFPSLPVIVILVECGANVNVIDSHRNTPLYNAVKFINQSQLQEDEKHKYFRYLIENGAHVDICNKNSQTALALMLNQGLPVCPLSLVSLKCMASRTIMMNQVPFRETIPVSLIPFVEMHGCGEKLKLE